MKRYFDADLDVDGLSVFHRWLKTPLPHGLESLRVQSIAQTTNYLDITRFPRRVHDQPKDARTLGFGPSRIFRIFRTGGRDPLRRGDTAANFVNTAANASAATSTYARPVANAHTSARTRSNTSA